MFSICTLFYYDCLFIAAQPPGVPEICRKSLVSCPASGGLELFLLGKNFLKDTKVVFQTTDECKSPQPTWEECVLPDKEFLQQVLCLFICLIQSICIIIYYIHILVSVCIYVHMFVLTDCKFLSLGWLYISTQMCSLF